VSARFTPYALDDGHGGHGVWDNDLNCRLEQPDLSDAYWFASQALAETWIARQEPTTPPGAAAIPARRSRARSR
jgi:hypothetical protein